MELQSCFPIWDKLSAVQQDTILGSLISRQVKKGALIHSGSTDCTGLLLVKSGQLRAYILSDEGREVTIYRLFGRDICLFSASCMLRSAQFDVTIDAEKDTDLWIIPAEVYRRVMEESAPLSNYTNEIMAARFSEVMWLVEQIMWKSMDRRVAAFLLEESAIEGGDRLFITHETIANHLGTHREVVTRMLRYLQDEGLVKLSRGTVELRDPKGLTALRDN
ncbi:MAG: Crp/Fnr family transcriptional regulator [Lawsonibacter sp.]|nr:Crp/Fnr family transcriptional regulator [Lawsonibacter sp.]